MALQWVKSNIEFFGGDPSQITLMGQGSGAESVALHLMSPISKNLFQRAIIHSAGATPRWGFLTNEQSLIRSGSFFVSICCVSANQKFGTEIFFFYLSFAMVSFHALPYTSHIPGLRK
jgi:hypothetical protein